MSQTYITKLKKTGTKIKDADLIKIEQTIERWKKQNLNNPNIIKKYDRVREGIRLYLKSTSNLKYSDIKKTLGRVIGVEEL